MRLSRSVWSRILWILALLAVAAPALAGLSAAGARKVSFRAKGPIGLTIHGRGSDLKVVERGKWVEVSVGLAQLKTGIALRDRHMREKYLETQKYPRAKLRVEKASLKFPSPGSKVSATARGQLTLHGVTRNVSFKYTATGSRQRARVSGSLHVRMTDYNIKTPGYLGVTVKPGVDIAVEFGVSGG